MLRFTLTISAALLLAVTRVASAVTLSDLEESNRSPDRYVYKQVGDNHILLDVYTPRGAEGPAPVTLDPR